MFRPNEFLSKFKLLSLFLMIFCKPLSSLDKANLIVMRHGEGEHNPKMIFSSWTKAEGGEDPSLTEKGRLQVAHTADLLLKQEINFETVGLVLVSPMIRTCQTAQILVDKGVCSEEVLHVDERIREVLRKDWEGKAIASIPELVGVHSWIEETHASAKHGGESVQSVYDRVESVVKQLTDWDASKGHIILVTHGFPTQMLLEIYGESDVQVQTAEAKVLPLPSTLHLYRM